MLLSPFTLIVAESETGGLLSNQAVVAGLAIAGTILVMRATRRNWMRSKSSTQPSIEPNSERFAKLKVEKTATRDLEDAMYELDQLSRQVHGRLDTKFAKLEMVIRDADERIDKLSRLTRSAEGNQTLDVTLEKEDPLVAAPRDAMRSPSRCAENGGEVAAARDPGGARIQVDARPSTPDRAAPMESAARAQSAPNEADMCDELFSLDAQGLPATEIAQRIGRTAGEVELILSLRKTQQQAATSKA